MTNEESTAKCQSWRVTETGKNTVSKIAIITGKYIKNFDNGGTQVQNYQIY